MKYYAPDFATHMSTPMTTRGKYAKGFPYGVVVHYTAGRDGADKTIQGGIKNGYTYWCIQKDGRLFVAHDANRWGYHAGKSAWKGFLGGVNDDLLGIEMNCAGKVEAIGNGKFKTWYGDILNESQVRYSAGKDNQAKGFYEKYTEAQEETLIKTILWLYEQNPKVFSFDKVLGHDEVSGPKGIGFWRKTDPGAALSCTMSEFRKALKDRYASSRSS